ncbi:hypothetical protein PTKIN_Ptkin11bG0054700 [Pterospermum kingtungense]
MEGDQTSAASNMKTTTLPNEKKRKKDAASNIKQVKRRKKDAAKPKQNDGSDIVKSAGQEDDNLRLCASDPEVSKDHSSAGLSISNQLDGKFEEQLPTMSPPKERARRATTQMPMPEPRPWRRHSHSHMPMQWRLHDFRFKAKTSEHWEDGDCLKNDKFKMESFDLRGGGGGGGGGGAGGGGGGGGGGTGQGVDQGSSNAASHN